MFSVPDSYVVQYIKKLSPSASKVYLYLLYKMAKSHKVEVNVETICEVTGASARAVRPALKELVSERLISLDRKGRGRGNGKGRVCHLVITISESASIAISDSNVANVANSDIHTPHRLSSKSLHSKPRVSPPTGNVSSTSSLETSKSTLQTTRGVMASILKEEMYIQNPPPAGGKFDKLLCAMVFDNGANWFRSYARWYRLEKLKRLKWTPSLFTSSSLIEEFNVDQVVSKKGSRGLDAKGQLVGVNSDAFKARVQKIREESKHLK